MARYHLLYQGKKWEIMENVYAAYVRHIMHVILLHTKC